MQDADMPLGRDTTYPDHYDPALLCPISRSESRHGLGLGEVPPFSGADTWHAWELTWLAPGGLPRVATAEIIVPADSPRLVESKSLKLYLNAFSMSEFQSGDAVESRIASDLTDCLGAPVTVRVSMPPAGGQVPVDRLPGACIDDTVADCGLWEVEPKLLCADPDMQVDETLYSHLLRSLCPVTAQPDMGSVLIRYRGPRIDRAGLLRYIVSFRRHQDFHEACVERMFVDIMARCAPVALSVQAFYTRRGGIDINPFRSNDGSHAMNLRLWRQ